MEPLFILTKIDAGLAGIATFLFIIQVVYYTLVYARPLRAARKVQPPTDVARRPVSVIVYAKNESENLRKHLPDLLTQEYPVYEVIVINDGSTDESDEVLKTLSNDYPHLYHTYIPEDAKYLSRKKLSLTLGIKAAKYDLLLFTEANCRPLTPQWIRAMAEAYRNDQTEIVLGFCAYRYYKSFFHKLVAYDNLFTGLQSLSSASAHHPYTGNGRNLSYRKPLFFDHKGYSHTLYLHAGDDDLFINEAATAQNTEAAYTADSLTEMGPIEYFSVWKEMKVSRAATQKYYKGGQLTFYRAEEASFFLFVLSVIALVVWGSQENLWLAAWGISLYLFRYLIKAALFYRSARAFGQKPLLVWLPLLELAQPLFNLYVRVYRLFRGKNDYTFRLGNMR